MIFRGRTVSGVSPAVDVCEGHPGEQRRGEDAGDPGHHLILEPRSLQGSHLRSGGVIWVIQILTRVV